MNNTIYTDVEFYWYGRALALAQEISGLEDVSKEFGKPENASLSLFVAMYSYFREHHSELCNTNRKLLKSMVHELSKMRYCDMKSHWLDEDEPGYYLMRSFLEEHERVVRNSISSLTRRILFYLYGIETGTISSNDIDTVYCEKPAFLTLLLTQRDITVASKPPRVVKKDKLFYGGIENERTHV